MSNAANPEGTTCSANESVRFPPINNSVPTTAMCPSWRGL